MGRRLREEPLVPLGCAVTAWAVMGAMRSMRKGDQKRTNLYFRRRLYAQAFTIVAMVAGNMYWQKDRVKRKEYDRLIAEQEHQRKRAKWLRELEVRDDEERATQARLTALRANLRAPQEKTALEAEVEKRANLRASQEKTAPKADANPGAPREKTALEAQAKKRADSRAPQENTVPEAEAEKRKRHNP